mgnify:CR=1 FL=1
MDDEIQSLPKYDINCPFSRLLKSEKTEKANVEVNIRGEWIGDRKYINEYFGFVTEVPVEWYLKKGTNDDFKYEAATEFLGSGDENLKALLKSSIEKNYTVFKASRHPLGTPGKTNPNVAMMVENIGDFPGIKSAKDYLFVMEDTLKMTNKKFSFAPDVTKVDLGGVEFWMRESSFTLGATEVHSKDYAKMRDNYILVFVVTTISEDDENTVSELIRTIKIN